MTTHTLTGHILERGTPRGVANLRVEAWDSESIVSDVIAVATTDAQGSFTITVDSDYLRSHFGDRLTSLAFRVFRTVQIGLESGGFATTYAHLVTRYFLWKLAVGNTSVRLEVDLAAPTGREQHTPSIVRGVLRSAAGVAVSGATVTAYDQNLTGDDALGAPATTDAAGRYQITYSELPRAGKLRPDLLVRAATALGAPLAESTRICHAPATVTVELSVGGEYRGPSEYETLVARLSPLTAGFDLGQATEEQIERLACSAGTDTDRITALVTALSLAASTGLAAPVLYGFVRKGLPSTRRELLVTRPVDLRRALEDALADNLIPATLNATLDATMTALRQATIALAFEAPPATATGSLGDLLATVLPTRAIQEELLDVYLSHTGTQEEFWTALGLRTSFQAAGRVANLQLAFQLGALTRQHFPLLLELQARKTAGTITSFRDLAGYSEADWNDVLDVLGLSGSAIGYPSDTPGSSAAEKKAGYARVLKSTMEAAFPTDAIKHDHQRSLPTGGLSLTPFFDQNPGFAFGATRVGDYLARNAGALDGYSTSDRASVAAQLGGLERLFRITPKYSEMKLFLDDGHDSARSLMRMGKSAFMTRYRSGLGGETAAAALFSKAQNAADHATALYSMYNAEVNPSSGYGLPGYVMGLAPPPSQIADYKTLFGSADGCECEHCTSVYSAAAYLVDLLQFLGRYPSKVDNGSGFWSAREILIGNVPTLVAQPSTRRRSDIGWLALSCENTDTVVPYVDLVNEILAHAVASSSAPYNALIATVGTAEDLAALPQKLTIDEEDLRTTAYTTLATASHPFEAPFHLWAEEARVYLQHLGVPRGGLMHTLREEVSGGPTVPTPALIAAERVGLTPYERDVVIGAAITAPTTVQLWDFWRVANDAALNGLKDVPTFLQRSGLEYDGLLDLLDCDFLQGFGPHLDPIAGGSACHPDQMRISWTVGMDNVAWSAIHRFLRLQRRLGWSISELDQVVMASGGLINDACLAVVAVVLRFHAEWEVPIPVLASWFGDLDTRRRDGGRTPSYYEQVFQNKAVSGEDELEHTSLSGTLVEHADAIRGALRINAADFALLTDTPVLLSAMDPSITGPIAGTTASLASLSKLHRIVTFARAAGLSIKDFLLLGRLSGILDQTATSAPGFVPGEVESFLDVVATVRRSGFAPVDIAYLISRIELPGATVIPDDAVVDKMLDELATELKKLTIADGDAEAANHLVQQTLAASLKLDLRTTVALLEDLLTFAETPPVTPARKLTSALGLDPSVDRPKQRKAYRHLAAAASVIGKLDLTATEVASLGSTLFAFDATPRDPSFANPATRFASLLTLVELRAFRSPLVGADTGLLAIFSAPSAAAISAATGWPEIDITALVTAFGLTLATAGDALATAHVLLRLREAFVVLKRLGVPVATALDWIETSAPIVAGAATPAEDIAGAIIQAAKAKYGPDEWATVAPPIRDVLREKQRKALVSYLVATNGYADSDALFARLLVDVETSPAQLTSRIKQAIGSVQTFVQRALLNLEPEVSLPYEAAHEWEWMKSYRVWEANRKVFLYPENWIEPELRDDKSPFFTAMESELRQKDMTPDVAEAAFGHYLERLYDVAHLDVVAMYHQKEETEGLHPAIDVLHVIGRTASVPRKHFYRTRVDGARWTAWDAIDLEIDGDHVTIAIMNRRPHLFWPLIVEKADPQEEQPTSDPDKPGEDARTHLEIRLAWSDYRSGKWSSKRVGAGQVLRLGAPMPTLDASAQARYLSFVLEQTDATSGIAITCLVNTACWGLWPSSMLRVGSFLLDTCGSKMEIKGEALQVIITSPINFFVTGIYSAENGHEQVKLELPSGTQMDGQDAVGSYYEKLNMSFVLEDQQSKDTVLGANPRERSLLVPHLIGFGTVPGQDTCREAETFFYKERSATFFAELETTTLTTFAEASKAHPGLPGWVNDIGGASSGGISSQLQDWGRKAPADSIVLIPNTTEIKKYRFSSFYHPYACLFLSELNRAGVDGLLKWSMSSAPIQLTKRTFFVADYHPSPSTTVKPYPVDDVDFSFRGAYSIYNWELFFHAPFLIATRLMANQRFADAQRWFHYIFDPTSGGSDKAPRRFWKVRPFYENVDIASIEEELTDLAEAEWSGATSTLAGLLGAKVDDPHVKDLQAQIDAWRKQAFSPHLIARMRPLAYQKAVFLKYVENLLAWGDQLFGRDTLESINEATQLYILAGGILGKRPRRVRSNAVQTPKDYWDLVQDGLDSFSDALVNVENLLPEDAPPVGAGMKPAVPDLRLLAFCVPPNDAMLDLWDSVADRLFKIRHSMNLEGVVRQLPLFEPPIDPALLVQATALGVDLATAIADASAKVPHYRFSVMHGKAMEICGSVIGLGGAFLSALEKKDAEGLSRLRSGHEIEMLKLVRENKVMAIKDAANNVAALEKSLEVVQIRYDYYRQLGPLSGAENDALLAAGAAALVGVAGQIVAAAAPAAQNFPTVTFGSAGSMGSPVTLNIQGGQVEGAAVAQEGQALAMSAGLLREGASIISTMAGYERRANEWKLQERLARKEITQMQKQIVGAKIRVAMAEADLAHHERQIEQTQEVDAYLRDKFTNEALYDRMVGQLSTVYFESYKLAYDVAKKAERAFKFELGLDPMSPNMVTFGYWDSLKQGLLAGEQLQHDLRRQEVAYLDQNARELEIIKHISLAEIDPEALLMLRETGTCNFQLEEALFDADYPEHYLRRIRSVSVTLPAVTGPYTGVSCALTLSSSRIRRKDSATDLATYDVASGSNADQFMVDGARGPVVTSSAQNDAGMFEVNLREERYLPFEGAGVFGSWTVALPKSTNRFDVSTIDDLILHVRYTARQSNRDLFKGIAKPAPKLRRIFSARADFPDSWAQFMNPLPGGDQTLTFALEGSLFPYVAPTNKVMLSKATLYAQWAGTKNYGSSSTPLPFALTRPSSSSASNSFDVVPIPTTAASNLGKAADPGTTAAAKQPLGAWTIDVSSAQASSLPSQLRTSGRVDGTLQDIWLVCEYDAQTLA